MKTLEMNAGQNNDYDMTTYNLRRKQKYAMYRKLYKEYQPIFDATLKKFHSQILEHLYNIKMQQCLRSLVLVRHGTFKENSKAKLLWIENPFNDTIINDKSNYNPDISEFKSFPKKVHAFPIKQVSKSLVCHRDNSSMINIETKIKLFNGSTKVFSKEFNQNLFSATRKRHDDDLDNSNNMENDDILENLQCPSPSKKLKQ